VSLAVSKHFSLEELTVHHSTPDLANEPGTGERWYLASLCADLLEPIREILRRPMVIHSAYRSPAVNAAVGGAKTSAHLDGRAADWHAEGMSVQDAFEAIPIHLPYDQAIYEEHAGSRWVHLAISRVGKGPRRQRLIYTSKTHGQYLAYDPNLVV